MKIKIKSIVSDLDKNTYSIDIISKNKLEILS